MVVPKELAIIPSIEQFFQLILEGKDCDVESSTLTIEDYKNIINNYNNIDNIDKNSNVRNIAINGILYLQATKDIDAGTELTKIYGIYFWLKEFLLKLPKEDKIVDVILDLNDDYALEVFKGVKTYWKDKNRT